MKQNITSAVAHNEASDCEFVGANLTSRAFETSLSEHLAFNGNYPGKLKNLSDEANIAEEAKQMAEEDMLSFGVH